MNTFLPLHEMHAVASAVGEKPSAVRDDTLAVDGSMGRL